MVCMGVCCVGAGVRLPACLPSYRMAKLAQLLTYPEGPSQWRDCLLVALLQGPYVAVKKNAQLSAKNGLVNNKPLFGRGGDADQQQRPQLVPPYVVPPSRAAQACHT